MSPLTLSDSLTGEVADWLRSAGGPDEARGDRAALRCHDAFTCHRRRWYAAAGVPADREPDAETMIGFEAGKMWHRLLQRYFADVHNARCEVPVDWRPTLDLDGTADAVYEEDEVPILVEIKSLSTNAMRRAEKGGPRLAHIVQAGCYALARQINAQAVRMIYINRDSGRIVDWVFGLDEPVGGTSPLSIRQLVREELAVVASIASRLNTARPWLIPWRRVPGVDGVVADPLAPGAPPQCRGCLWRERCAADGP